MSTATRRLSAASRAALAVAALCSTAAIVLWPTEGAMFVALLWGITLVWLIPPQLSVALPLFLLLSIPADYMWGLGGSGQGFFVSGVMLTLIVASGIRSGLSAPSLDDWDVYLLIGLLCGATLLHAGSGELRGILFWVGAGVLLWWLRMEEHSGLDTPSQVVHAVIAAGALGGLVAILGRIHVLDARSLLPGYAPRELSFSYETGTRAAGLSGHPLRLGTLTMLGALLAFPFLLHGRDSRRRWTYIGLIGLTLGGLVFSGARGSWLGFAIGILVLAMIRFAAGDRKVVLRALQYGVVAGFALWITGVWKLMESRVVGEAAHPGSIAQRVNVTEGIRYVWSQVPPLGVGFGGAAEMAMRMGLRLLNLENEYLRFFFTAGLAGPIALLWVAVRRAHRSLTQVQSSPIRTGALCALPALVVNVGTYNVFSWSMGPSLLAAIAFIALPPRATGQEPTFDAGAGT